MKIKNSSKINKNNLLFSIAYVLFVFSLFNRDVSNIGVLYPLTIPAKYIAVVILTVGIMFRAYPKKQIRVVIILLCADLLVLMKSGELIFILISLFAFLANKMEDKDILKVAYFALLFFTLCVFAFSIVGIYNDEITKRWVGSAARHSLGFYHSNVLPLIYSYLVGYGLLTGIFKKKHYFILLTVDLVIYYFCGSRNSFFTIFLLVLGKWFNDSVIETGRFKKIINRIVGFVAKLIVPLLTAFSVFIPLMLDKVDFFRTLDYMLSYRFTYIASMIQNLGISLIPKMTNEAYFGNGIVIDNGYAFLIIRYGVLMIIFLSILIYCVAKKYKNNTFVLFLIIVVACSNLIDNDLIDYSVLPYLIISEKCLIEGLRRRLKGEVHMEDLISVIMSTYNESVFELRESIESVLKQTYSNIEFVIVIDNPNNEELSAFIYSFDDPRIRVIKNDRNIGLVNSLNKAICQSKGEYLARMDADDICEVNRLKLQKEYLDKNNLDLVGGSVCLIDENGNYISKLHFPYKPYLIKHFLKWGNCIPHPTWLVRKEVYTKLNGYRDVPRCEDYDFVCRSVQNHFKLGNVNEFILKYRIRSDSVSNSNKAEQYILRRFISKNRKTGVTEQEIRDYLNSDLYYREIVEYEKFQKIKKRIKNSPNIVDFVKLCGNINTYYLGIEKVCLKIRNLV